MLRYQSSKFLDFERQIKTLKDTESAIETRDLKAGMYWIQVKDPNTSKVKTLKWIKS